MRLSRGEQSIMFLALVHKVKEGCVFALSSNPNIVLAFAKIHMHSHARAAV